MMNLTVSEILEAAERLEHGFSIYNQDLSLLFANKVSREHFTEMFEGLERGEDLKNAVEHQVDTLAPGLSNNELHQAVEETISNMRSGEEREVPGSNGRTIRIYHSPTNDGKVVGISVDVTDLKQRQKELKKARRSAEAASEAKSEFLAAMSHEIRTPLNGILGMAQALGARDLSLDEQDMVNTILESSKSLMTILNDILDLSKIEAGKLELSPVSGDLRHKLTRLQKFYLPSAEEKGLYLKLVIDPNVPSTLVFDPVRVRQSVSNLISNALKFTSTGGVIVAVKSAEIPNKPGEHMVTVHVSDTGIGITKEQRKNLFSNFSQADSSTTRKFGGTGLGLAISQRLAHMMGGNIKVHSQEGKGSVFTLSFRSAIGEPVAPAATSVDLETILQSVPKEEKTPPRAPKPQTTLESVLPEAASSELDAMLDDASEWIEDSSKPADEGAGAVEKVQRSTNSLRGLRVLIVDDNAVNRRVARLLIEPQGLIATEAENGREALDMLAREPFDLVLLDMHMPVMDGRETIKFIRASSERWQEIPVIALTADAMSGDREKCLDLGMDGYVAKPVDQRELFVEVLEVINQAANDGRMMSAEEPSKVAPVPEDTTLDDLFDLASGA